MELHLVHDFGLQPLAGVFPALPVSRAPVKTYPLELYQCAGCGLLQILELPPIDEVFHDEYRYSSSTVPGLVRHFEGYAEWLSRLVNRGTKVFEFGCNDGVLLERLRARGFHCAGLDASDNVASLARAKGLSVTTGFLSSEFVRGSGLDGCFELVTCSNVLAHIHALSDTLAAVRRLLTPTGLFVIEVHDSALLIDEGQFDTIYHEHLTYFTEATLRDTVERSGFSFVGCERTAMHGGALRLVARRSEATIRDSAASGPRAPPVDFVVGSLDRCHSELNRLHERHGALVGYGAAGRSQMFINFTDSARLFESVFDDSPLRQGRFIAGTDIPIHPYRGESGNCAVVLAWNYASDIAGRIRGRYTEIVTLIPATQRW